MAFAYYRQLNRKQQQVYRRSDEITRLRLSGVQDMQQRVAELNNALQQASRTATQSTCQLLADAIVADLKAPAVAIKVMDRRPSNDEEELHGLYVPSDGGQVATISLWMRTARRQQVVAFRTFLRTLLHELCHHLDYELLQLEESFHTEGFYKRESSLFWQLVPDRKKA
jgi:hypothetical protein